MKTNFFSNAIILSIFLLNGFALTAQTAPNYSADPNTTADKIIYISSASGNSEIMQVDSDGTNPVNLTNNAANDSSPAYSPTLDKIVFVSDRTGTNQIWVMNADCSGQTNLSNSPMSNDTNPSWSPDGAKIVFVRDEPIEFSDDGVSTMNADGSNQFRVYYLSNFSGKPAFSPDGTYILFYDGFNVLSVEPNGANISFVVSADSGSPTYLSPDGAKLLFVNFDEFGVRQIFTVSNTGANYTQLTFFATDAILPKWSPDGSKITFAVLFASNAFRIYTMNADGSNQTEITPNPSSAETYGFPEWSPDNLRIAFTGNYQISSQNFTGLGKINSDGTNLSFLAAADIDKPLSWIDPTALPVIRFSRSGFLGFNGFEGFDLERQIKVVRSGDLSAATTINYATANGTATAGVDYEATNGTLNFAPGEITKTIIIPTLDDTVVEADETFSLTLSNPSGGTIAPPSTEILTIRNDDTQYEFRADSLNQSVSETATEAQFRIVRTGRFGEESITFSTTDGTATAPQDYSTVSTNVNFAESQTEAIISVTLNPDNAFEGNEFFNAALSNPPFGATLGANFSTQFNILDDDIATHSVQNAAYSVQETAGTISVVVRRDFTSIASSVSYRTVDGTATQPGDYTPTTGTLNFAVGVSQITVNVPIINNSAPEFDETFRFELFNQTPGELGTPNTAVITILDAQAKTVSNNNDSGAGSLRQAIANAASGSTIFFAPNVTGTITLTSASLTFDKSLTILGPGANILSISGNNAFRVFTILDSFANLSVVNISGLRITGGINHDGFASFGGIIARRTALTLSNCVISGNSGGGVDASPTLNMDSCIVSNNAVLNGGAVNSFGGAITNSVISNNTVGAGATQTTGLLVIQGNPVTVTNTTISGNSSLCYAGGIYNSLGNLTLDKSAVVNNQFTSCQNNGWGGGGGIFNAGGLTIKNSTISGNTILAGGSGVKRGGGIFDLDVGFNANNLIIVNSTIANNTAPNIGGIYHQGGAAISVRNTIVATNGTDVFGAFASQGNNLIGNTTGGSGFVASDLQNMSAMLAPLGNNGGATMTHALMPNSPAIDAGNNCVVENPGCLTTPLTTDQRGYSRLANGGTLMALNVDIGAYEHLAPTAANVSVSGRVSNSNGSGIGKARVSLTDSSGNTRTLQTNPFGYYKFDEVSAGETYIISVNHKRYVFNPNTQVLNVSEDLSDVNFTASE